MRRAAKVDANQPDIVAALRKIGARVQHLHGVGGGCADLLVGHGNTLTLVEVKDGSRPPSEQKLNALQEEFHAQWEGFAFVVKSPEEAVSLILGRTQGVK